MKFIKKGLAVMLAALLVMPTLSVSAEELTTPADSVQGENNSETGGGLSVSENIEESASPATNGGGILKDAEDPGDEKNPSAPTEGSVDGDNSFVPGGNLVDGENLSVPTGNLVGGENLSAEDGENASTSAEGVGESTEDIPSLPKKEIVKEEILFNTGNHVWSVVDQDTFDSGEGDAWFEEDGSYTINIPEENPFFPYEVQFSYEGETENYWFMTPDSSVEVGGHVFRVSAYFDNTAVTQMSLDVAGNTVIVYPEEKKFTDDGEGTSITSLLPLEEKNLRVNLQGYTPVELSMTSVSSIFTGSDSLTDPSKVIWTYRNEDDYTVSMPGDKINLSYGTSSGSSRWEMIVGEVDQLAGDNIRYNITLNVTASSEWLTPTVYMQDDLENRTNISVWDYDYYDYSRDDYYPRLYIYMPSSKVGNTQQIFTTLEVNSTLFSNTKLASYKIYEGQFAVITEAVSGTDITDQIINTGYMLQKYSSQWVTMVGYDGSGSPIGCLPFRLYWSTADDSTRVNVSGLRDENNTYVYDTYTSGSDGSGCINCAYTLYKGYAANQTYYLRMYYYQEGYSMYSAVTAAYVGQYSSIAQAASAGASDIKDDLFGNKGYAADYSSGVYFTIFVGEDGAAEQEIYQYCVKAQEGTVEKPLNSGTSVRFDGLKDSSGAWVDSYIVNSGEDSYGENNYITILVGADADLSSLAPTFSLATGAKLHAAESSKEEISGVSLHDFSKGAVHYTVSSENHASQEECWLQVVKASDGPQLYINSLANEKANTYTDANGVICSIREIMLDGYHNYWHDIFLANMGMTEIPALSAELVSDVVELDEYWKLNGEKGLSGFSTLKKDDANAPNGELPNLAKIRIRAKEGTEAKKVSGTLTIKSGNTTLVVLTLTGVIGDPSITTPDIPEAVKYVPYGPIIQSNNMYKSWNRVSYFLIDGNLPDGVEVKPNGEIYGVPLEAGEFTFTVRMTNSYSGFKPSEKTYTLTVLENTDANVDGATDEGYFLTQRVQDIYLQSVTDVEQLMISEGIYGEFEYIFLDGVKLVEGIDYKSESGSTRITILNQTLKLAGSSSVGTHTLGIEFRTQDDKILRAAGQNYVIHDGVPPKPGNSGSSSSNNSNSSNESFFTVDETIETVVYTVAAGDTLWKIAQKYYGSGTYWTKIYADNADTISDPNKIYVGQQITIYLTGGSSAGTTNADGTSYTVASGDTLWKIARRLYGKGRYWKKIYEANTDIIADPSRIYIGQILILPED